jgi:omega-6 fatty acid desaturase (delta-12 desaturase)
VPESRRWNLTTRLPKDADLFTRTEEVTLGALRRVIPHRLVLPSELRSWLALLRVFGMVALIAYVTSRIELRSAAGWVLFGVLTVAQGVVLVGLFVLGHDCGHGSFSRRRRVNQVVGHLTMAPLFTTLRSWQLFHDHHHRWPQKHDAQIDVYRYLVTRDQLGRAELLTRLGYSVPGGFIFWILGGIYRRATLLKSIPELVRSPAEARRVKRSAAITLSLLALLWTVIGLTAGPAAILKYHLAPVLVSTLIGSLLVTVQHTNMEAIFYAPEAWTPLRGQVVSTFDVRFPRLLEWLWCDINLHIPHHVAPRLPWYHLRPAAALLFRAYPELYQERSFGMSELRFLWRVPLLRRVPGMGYFDLVAPQELEP